jgi:hypothetical protein
LDPLSREAVGGLAGAVSALIAESAGDVPAPAIEVYPLSYAPVGIGGVVALSADPAGEIVGRRLLADVRVTVRTADAADLGAAASEVARALVGAGRASLAGRGVHGISLTDPGVPAPDAPPAGERRLAFRVRYEFLKAPEAAGDVIASVPLDLDLLPDGRTPRPLVRLDLGAGSLGRFDLVDDPSAGMGGPSQWAEDAADGHLEQRSGIHGGSFQATPNKPGTYAVLRGAPAADLRLRATLATSDGDGVGVVFRWLDVDNFYFFLMDAKRGRRMIAKKSGGTFRTLDTPALDAAHGFTVDAPHTVKVLAVGARLEAAVDGEPPLVGEDASLAGPGQVGLMCFGDDGASFYRLELAAL